MKSTTFIVARQRHAIHRSLAPLLGWLWAVVLFAPLVPAGVIPPDQPVLGKSQAAWFGAFWQWFLEMAYDSHHPSQDLNGEHALRNQSGPVWFLVPASSRFPVTRSIAIPEGQWLLVSMTGSGCTTLDVDPYYGSNEAECRACAQGFEQDVSYLEVDGEIVANTERFLLTSTFFDFVTDPAGFGTLPGNRSGQGVGYGGVVMIEPMTPGTHRIQFQSSQPDEGVSYDVTYNIEVYARPTLQVRPLPGTGDIEVSWPDREGFRLQGSINLGLGVEWSDVSLTSSVVVDGIRTLKVPSLLQGQYLRLFRP